VETAKKVLKTLGPQEPEFSAKVDEAMGKLEGVGEK
jgi:hypothetical protein